MKMPPVNQEELLAELLQNHVDKLPSSKLNQVTQAELVQQNTEETKVPVKS